MSKRPSDQYPPDYRISLSEYHINNVRRSSTVSRAFTQSSPWVRIMLFATSAIVVFWLASAFLVSSVTDGTTFWQVLLFRGPAGVVATQLVAIAVIGILGANFGSVRADQLERALQRSSRWFSTVLQSIGNACIATDQEGDIIFLNPAAERLVGQSVSEAIGKSIEQVCTIDNAVRGTSLGDILKKGLDDGVPIVFGENAVLHSASGHEIPITGTAAPIVSAGGETIGMVVALHNMSELRQAEEKADRLASVVAQSDNAIVICSPDGLVEYANPKFESLTGFAPHEIIGQPFGPLRALGEETTSSTEFVTRLEQIGFWRGNISLTTKGGRPFEVVTTISALRDSEGEISGYAAINRDVSYETELRAQLTQAQKMEVIGRLAGGVVHDFNNILQVICGYSCLIEDAASEQPELLEFASHITQSAERAVGVTCQLLAFSRRGDTDPVPVDPNHVIQDTGKMVRRLIGTDVELIMDLKPEIGLVLCDPGQFSQVLLNLAVNADDAMPDGGKLTVSTCTRTVAAQEPAEPGEEPILKAGPYVVTTISDTGTGIDPEHLESIFQPFFTTKEVGKGTGLGLSIVRDLARQFQGDVRASSKLGEGTEFEIFLPVVQKDATAPPVEVDLQQTPSGTERLVVVDDDKDVLQYIDLALGMLGYEVLTANNAKEGIRLCSVPDANIDLLITDLVMPKTDGMQLASKLRELVPEIPILYMTAHPEHALRTQHPRELRHRLLEKPFSLATLAASVRNALDRR
ncbi:MAG: PAS domain-containing protein [Lentisphaeria bacterium]|nr:PAS domain-containing protein [Lentisphaeria bacterium]